MKSFVHSLNAVLISAVLCLSTSSANDTPVMQEVSPGVYQLGKLRIDKNANSITFPAAVNMVEGWLEYLLVTPQGATHESLLITEIQPSDLHLAMLLLGAKGAGIATPAPGDAPPTQIDAEYLKRAPKLRGDALTITATWGKDADKKSARIEEWIANTDLKKPLEKGPWIYTGSMFAAEQFLAQAQGVFAAVVTNPSALINNPRKGNDNDQIWKVNEKTVPPAETPLELLIHLETKTLEAQ